MNGARYESACARVGEPRSTSCDDIAVPPGVWFTVGYHDRWWQQRAILLYFKALLPKAQDDRTITTAATVNQSAGGTPLSTQLVDLGSPTRDQADRLAAPLVC